MYQVFNMGHRMEIYVSPARVNEVIDIARSFGIDAQQIGYTAHADSNHLTLTDPLGNRHAYT